MKIYTKTGDAGETSLVGGVRLKKNSARIKAYGDIDELSAVLGLCRAQNNHEKIEEILHRLQVDLFDLGADLATPLDSKVPVPRVQEAQVSQLEQWIDFFDAKVDPLKNFILPGGNLPAAQLHVARAVCRRAERSLVTLDGSERINKTTVKYINRLSDLLFMMARFSNKLSGTEEEIWKRL